MTNSRFHFQILHLEIQMAFIELIQVWIIAQTVLTITTPLLIELLSFHSLRFAKAYIFLRNTYVAMIWDFCFFLFRKFDGCRSAILYVYHYYRVTRWEPRWQIRMHGLFCIQNGSTLASPIYQRTSSMGGQSCLMLTADRVILYRSLRSVSEYSPIMSPDTPPILGPRRHCSDTWALHWRAIDWRTRCPAQSYSLWAIFRLVVFWRSTACLEYIQIFAFMMLSFTRTRKQNGLLLRHKVDHLWLEVRS